MKLLVDIGNSRIKWAFATGSDLVDPGEADRDGGDALRVLLDSTHVPDEIRVANVAGAEAGFTLAGALQAHFGVVPAFARSAASGAGVRNGYTDPAQLGVDRWLAICAAVARYGSPLCVVDAGTATTIDIVGHRGEHQGGLILPGIALMQSALLGRTGDLARLSAGGAYPGDSGVVAVTTADPAGPASPGRNTAAAIRSGALQATASLAQAWLDRLPVGPSSGGAPLLVLTGGAATALATTMAAMAGSAGSHRPPPRMEFRAQLVLEGLALEPPCCQFIG